MVALRRVFSVPRFKLESVNGCQLAVIVLAAIWLRFFNELRQEWQINPQYNYGFVVPLLGAVLIWRRWPERPSLSSKRFERLVGLVWVSLLLWLLPLRIIVEANPEWRLLYWTNGLVNLGLSFSLLYKLGGRRWATFFAPPLLFLLIAIPWPVQLEQGIIQGLMRFVAALTVEAAGWLGIPAVQHGNLIEVGVGIVGIDEACSGVRSLQSALMLSLFLGELHRFSATRRLMLVCASLIWVVVANLVRTNFLVWAAAKRGLHQMEAWHDTAGILVMVIVLPALMLLAHWMKPARKDLAPPVTEETSRLPILPRWVGIGALVWIFASELGTEAWYRGHETQLVGNVKWSVAWPTQSTEFKKSPVPEKSLAILRCSNSEAASWQDDEGNQWSAFLLRWKPGKNSAQLAKGHQPDICFPAAGARLVKDFGQVDVETGGFRIPFRHESFEMGSGLVHVFYCLWSDRVSQHEKPLLEDGSQSSRIQAVMVGKRNIGQQVLELVLAGPDSAETAVSLLRQHLPDLVQID